ncbi:MAG: CocE/NonD family hydrolase [Acidobacteria bacterium]|nr:CocE/NonD family hydrolase [Acidobacteriota bacterium]
MKIKFIAALLLIFGAFSAIEAQRQQLSPAEAELAKYIRENYTKREEMIPMRDGVRLFTSIYEPKERSKQYPILFSRTPYTVSPYGPNDYKTSLGPNELFAKEGYIFVYQDVRGRWMSEGVYEDVRPDIDNRTPQDIDESTDTYDTIEWLLKNVGSNNGRVGMWGISYPGFYTSAGAIDSHPALRAISPQAPVSDWFHGDDAHHNGALFLAQNYHFFEFFGQPRPAPTNQRYGKQLDWGTRDDYKFFLNVGGLREAADFYEKSLGTRISFWDAMMAHPNYDQFWKDRNILPKLKNIKAAVMTVGGWYDNEDLYGALNTYRAIEKQNPGIYNVLVVGPWFHGGWERSSGDWLGTAYFGQKTSEFYRAKFELPFFDHFLKDKGEIPQIKEVNLFDTGANEWKNFDTFTPSNVAETPLYLTANGGLSFADAAATSENGFNEYVSDPMKPVPYTQKITSNYPRDFMTEDQRFAATRPDVLVYQTGILKDDLTVAGDIKPSLFVSSTGTDSDFVVKLIDVFPDDYKYPEGVKPPENSAFSVFQPGGYEMLLRGEPFPARFRNSFEKPEPLKPNETTKIEYVMPGVVHTFKKGHRIMVQIQSTWFPLVARNPQQFMDNYKTATAADYRKATERVYFGNGASSKIMLPIVKN